MTTPVSASTTIAAPADVVFAILADPRQHARIDGSGTVLGVAEGPDRLELGSKFAMKMKMGAKYQTPNTVVEFEPDRLIAWKHFAPHRWRYELTPTADGGTEVTETWDISRYPVGARQLLSRMYAVKTQAGIEQTLVKLKEAAEADAAS